MELKNNTVIVVLGASGDLAKKKTVCNSSDIGGLH
jgi:glucose-6-phosphate 1-dehydrogenase